MTSISISPQDNSRRRHPFEDDDDDDDDNNNNNNNSNSMIVIDTDEMVTQLETISRKAQVIEEIVQRSPSPAKSPPLPPPSALVALPLQESMDSSSSTSSSSSSSNRPSSPCWNDSTLATGALNLNNDDDDDDDEEEDDDDDMDNNEDEEEDTSSTSIRNITSGIMSAATAAASAAAAVVDDNDADSSSFASSVNQIRAKQKLLRLHTVNKLAESKRRLQNRRGTYSDNDDGSSSPLSIDINPVPSISSSNRRINNGDDNKSVVSTLTELSTPTNFPKLPEQIILGGRNVSSSSSSPFSKTGLSSSPSISTMGALSEYELEELLSDVHGELVLTQRMLKIILICFFGLYCFVNSRDFLYTFFSQCNNTLHYNHSPHCDKICGDDINNNNNNNNPELGTVVGGGGGVRSNEKNKMMNHIVEEPGFFAMERDDFICLWLSQ